ncbi:MAG: IS91 family transposase, partial [Pyrinomonadaceae bacterium]
AVLHTWTRDLRYHPHVHMLVTAGGLALDGKAWLPARYADYLVPEGALAIIFRAKLCAALKKVGLLDQAPRQVWKKNWRVDCQAAGPGREVLNYLARYIFRVAISNSRLERIENGQVTFRYRDNRTQQLQRVTIPGEEFMRRFLLHILPRSCAKVRYYGLCSPTGRPQLEQARTLLGQTTANPLLDAVPEAPPAPLTTSAPARCLHCQLGQLFVLRVLPRQREPP